MKKIRRNPCIGRVGKRVGSVLLLLCAATLLVWSQGSGGKKQCYSDVPDGFMENAQIYELFMNGELTVEQDEKQLTVSELFLENDAAYCFLDIDGDGKAELHIRDSEAYYVINAEQGKPQIIFTGRAYEHDWCHEPIVMSEPCGILYYHNGYGFEIVEFIKISADGKRKSDGEFYWRDENKNGVMDEADSFGIGFIAGREIKMEQYMQYRDEQLARQAENKVEWRGRRLKNFATWQEAYIDFINKTQDRVHSEDAYCLVYVDGDDVPELYMDTWYGVTGEYIVSFYKGKVGAMNLARGGIHHIEYGGLLYTWTGNRIEEGHFDIYMAEKGIFSKIGRGWSFGNYDNGLDDVTFDYFWEGSPVTEAEFEACINKVIDTSKCAEPSVLYTKDEMLKMLESQ